MNRVYVLFVRQGSFTYYIEGMFKTTVSVNCYISNHGSTWDGHYIESFEVQ